MRLFSRVIPIWALIAVVCAGAVVASYCVWSHVFGITVTEPISVVVTQEFDETIEPGLGTMAVFEIHNSGALSHSVTVTWPQSAAAERPAIYATIRYIDSEGNSLDDIVRVDYDGTKTFKLYTDGHDTADGKSSYARVQVSILVWEDTPDGAYDIPVEVFRG